MGYYTSYSIDTLPKYLDNEAEIAQDLAKLVYGSNIRWRSYECLEEVFLESIKWYSYKDDMINFSKKYPDITFIVSGAGEDREDNWKHYFKNGKQQCCPGRIVYEDFDEEKME